MNARPPVTPPSASGPPTDEQLCDYIADMCGELRHLARRPQFRTISYLLDMARVEAERMAKALRSGA
ncbi:hypothetical protein [Lichenibacterium ramalinae]|uniref:Uncharacterized protein n=1 Tax=Lichenibacterium ramalinae TaxID=2316527 RepID=A0A4Q2RF51_9HYPH|nr:hypothetical protein [Lichenibacterium ramalinae]RYB04966.1 hypothetical protein D3272_10865 [Lichenibacterium ramalinae]